MDSYEKRLREATERLIETDKGNNTVAILAAQKEWDEALTAFFKDAWRKGYHDGLDRCEDIIRGQAEKAGIELRGRA